MNEPWKKILTILCLMAITFICMFAAIVMMFGGEGVYLFLVGIIYLSLLLIIPATIKRRYSPRVIRGLWLSLPVIIFLTVSVRESVRVYHDSFETFREDGLDLRSYQPFAEGSLAVQLDQPPTLSLTDSLPILDGATALYPVYAAFAQAVYPEGEYPYDDGLVICTTTTAAYERIVDGRADIIFVFGPSEKQRDYAVNMEVELEFTPIGREAFVFFVNSRNPVTGLSQEQIKSIYSGDIRNWKQVGGKNSRIRAFQRERGSGSQTALIEFMDGWHLMRPPLNDRISGMQPIIERTAVYSNYPNAIGFTFRHYAESMIGNDGIKLLSVDGVYPTRHTVENGEYPLSATFYAVTRSEETNPNVNRLVEWVLSPQGQEIIRLTGYNPLY